jgi:hypothetical protein
MRTIIKQKRCDSLTSWLWKERHNLYNDYKNTAVKSDTIWSKLPPDIKNELAEQLLKEQGYICCYCGQSINRNTMAIEHFDPRAEYKDKIFEYKNLFASCKCSDKKYYPYPNEVIDLQTLQPFQAQTRKIGQAKAIIAQKIGKNEENIQLDEDDKYYGLWLQNQNIVYKNSKPADHCDDKKGDKDPNGDYFIINPSEQNCEQYFEYEASSGEIIVHHVNANAHKNITEIVLNLNVRKLCNMRYEKMQKAITRIMLYRRMQLSAEQITKAVQGLNTVQLGKELEDFCFVEQYQIKKLLKI